RREDLFNRYEHVRQSIEITLGIAQAVDMIDAKPGDLSLAHELQYEFMSGLEYIITLGTQSGEVIDVEEPAVIDRVGNFSPVGQPVVLPRQHAVDSAGPTGRPTVGTDSSTGTAGPPTPGIGTEVFGAGCNRQSMFVILQDCPAIDDTKLQFTV